VLVLSIVEGQGRGEHAGQGEPAWQDTLTLTHLEEKQLELAANISRDAKANTDSLSGPSNAFDDISNAVKLFCFIGFMKLNAFLLLPPSRLLCNNSAFSLPRLASSDGMLPVKEFWLISRCVNWRSCPKDDGMLGRERSG
jgi:hypothetical protein